MVTDPRNVYSMNIQTTFFLVPELLNYTYKPGLSRAKFCVISWGLLLVLSKIVRSFHLDYTELRILRISSGCQLVYQESWKQDFVGCKAKIRYRAHPYDGTRIMFRLFVLSNRVPIVVSHFPSTIRVDFRISISHRTQMVSGFLWVSFK